MPPPKGPGQANSQTPNPPSIAGVLQKSENEVVDPIFCAPIREHDCIVVDEVEVIRQAESLARNAGCMAGEQQVRDA